MAKLKKTAAEMVAEARARIEEIETPDLIAMVDDPDVVIVDIRDPRERDRGYIPGSVHAPRGMVEFWIDPDSPYFKPVFGDGHKEFVLFCGAGWRSALAAKALQDMGMTNVAHIDGGFAAWLEAQAPTETLEEHKARHAARKAS